MIKLPIVLKEEKVEGSDTPLVKVKIEPQKDLKKATDNEVLVAKQVFDYIDQCLKQFGQTNVEEK